MNIPENHHFAKKRKTFLAQNCRIHFQRTWATISDIKLCIKHVCIPVPVLSAFSNSFSKFVWSRDLAKPKVEVREDNTHVNEVLMRDTTAKTSMTMSAPHNASPSQTFAHVACSHSLSTSPSRPFFTAAPVISKAYEEEELRVPSKSISAVHVISPDTYSRMVLQAWKRHTTFI